MKISEIKHPEYKSGIDCWIKWRHAYESGDAFIDNYLRPYSRRERPIDYQERRSMTYVPAYATRGINRIRNAIYSRLGLVRREGGSVAYQAAIKGEKGGVDRLRSSMATFIGMEVLPELLAMQKVGIYIDRPEGDPLTKADELGKNCYCYIYRREDVRAWSYDETNEIGRFKALLLRDCIYKQDDEYGLDSEEVVQYRLLTKIDSGITVKIFDAQSNQIDERFLKLPQIPFVFPSLQQSLMKDIAAYQVALMNLASTDLSYCAKSNYPFYIEQFDPKSENIFRKTAPQPAVSSIGFDNPSVGIVEAPATYPGEQKQAQTSSTAEVVVGVQSGRRYSTENPPQFIHPSPEPMLASMQKQDKMKGEIEELLHLALTNQGQIVAFNVEDGSPVEVTLDGLSYIGHVLQNTEQEIANFFALYEGNKEPAKIIYPTQYTLKSDSEIIEEAQKLQETAQGIPSKTYKQEMAKQIASKTVGTKITEASLKKIYGEIDDAPNMVSDPTSIEIDVNLGLVSLETAAMARGWDKSEPEKAANDHAERLARIAAAQAKGQGTQNMEARGVPDMGANPQGAKEEKADSQDPRNQRDISTKLTRGENK